MIRRKTIGMRMLALTVAALMSPLLMFSQNGKSQKMPSLELRLKPGKLVSGIPESFTFVFINISNHDVRMPQPSRCIGEDGRIVLKLDFVPDHPVNHGMAGGCADIILDGRSLIESARQWHGLKPGKSMSISYRRKELFAYEQAPGTYEFWAEYTPPKIPAEDQRILTEEGIDFPRSHLVSPHLTFVRKK